MRPDVGPTGGLRKIVRGRGRRWPVLAVLVAAIGFALAQPPDGHALAVTHKGDCWGNVTFQWPFGAQAADMQVFPGNWTVTRAGCSRATQKVTFNYRFWGLDTALNKWIRTLGPLPRTKTLVSGARGSFTHNWYVPRYRRISIDVVITWRTRKGRFIGQTHLDFNRRADYRCGANCTTHSSNVVGAYFYFAPLVYDYRLLSEGVMCNLYLDQYNNVYSRQIIPKTPAMFAPTAMTVSWQPVLFVYQSGNWQQSIVGSELVGYFNGLYSNLPASPPLNPSTSGSYRVAVYYRWYSNGVLVHTDYQWANEHTLQYWQLGSNTLGASSYYCPT